MINKNESVGGTQTLAMIYVSVIGFSLFVVLGALCHEITLLLLFPGIRNKTTERKIYLPSSSTTQQHHLEYKAGFLDLKPPHCF